MASRVHPVGSPSQSLPKSSSTCQVSIINTTCDITVPPHYLIQPKVVGYDWINLPTYSYHIKHKQSGKELLFDLGCRKDWQNLVPHLRDMIKGHVNGLKVQRNVQDILSDGGVQLSNIEALVLSHFHFDHSGDLSKLPKSTKVIVGPGFKDAFTPGYPSRQDSPFHEADFEGRETIELAFSDGLKIGDFRAHDYFEDSSFYILDVPGHAVGHICGLARTTPDTFVFLGGDACHFTGVIRPTSYVPMPEFIPEGPALDKRLPHPCPCSSFLSSHPQGSNSNKVPFFKVSTDAMTFYADPAVAQQSANALTNFDADPNIMVTIAHDPAGLDVYDFFPNGTLNDWQQKGWKEDARWGFLSELPFDGKIVRPTLVDGLYMDGVKVRGLELPQ